MTMELGGNISLSGFSERDFTELIVVKKIVGQYARKLTDTVDGFSRISITLKDVHHTPEGHAKAEVTTHVTVAGHTYESEVIDQNLFVALDAGIKHCLEQIHKAQEKLHS